MAGAGGTTRPLIVAIQRHVAAHYGVPPGALAAPRQDAHITRPRHVAAYLARRMTQRSYATIGRAFNRAPATVRASCRVVEERMDDPAVAAEIDGLLIEIASDPSAARLSASALESAKTAAEYLAALRDDLIVSRAALTGEVARLDNQIAAIDRLVPRAAP